jgi:transcriptional regulator with XRE-family HTH domain
MHNHAYDDGHRIQPRGIAMPSKKSNQGSNFGQRMAELRKATGYTQVELAKELGSSQRMISHYEGRAEHPPTAALPALAKVFGVTTDELLGVIPVKKARNADTHLERRLQQIQRLDPKPRKQIMQLIDTFIEAEQLKQKANAGNS